MPERYATESAKGKTPPTARIEASLAADVDGWALRCSHRARAALSLPCKRVRPSRRQGLLYAAELCAHSTHFAPSSVHSRQRDTSRNPNCGKDRLLKKYNLGNPCKSVSRSRPPCREPRVRRRARAVAALRLVRLRQEAVRRTAGRPRLSRPRYPPRRDLKFAADRARRGGRHLQVKGLPDQRPRSAQDHDARRPRVHPPLSPAHLARRLPPHPPL
jgi:hypothetical protein